MRPLASAAAAAALLVVLVGCSAPGGDMTNPSTSGRPSFQTTGPLPSNGTPVTLSEAQLAAIKADLAARGVTVEFTVDSAVAVTWSDGSWAAPSPERPTPRPWFPASTPPSPQTASPTTTVSATAQRRGCATSASRLRAQRTLSNNASEAPERLSKTATITPLGRCWATAALFTTIGT